MGKRIHTNNGGRSMSKSVSEQEIKFIEFLHKHENARDLLKAYFKGMAEA